MGDNPLTPPGLEHPIASGMRPSDLPSPSGLYFDYDGGSLQSKPPLNALVNCPIARVGDMWEEYAVAQHIRDPMGFWGEEVQQRL